jgi:hypothetical protein
MGRAGQRNITGISAQADVTLFYLLQTYKRSDFREIVIEGDKWEDFTLVFNDRIENFEVKWHQKPVPIGTIRKIIEKELDKDYGENDSFKIATKRVSPDFKKSYDYLKNSFFWSFGDSSHFHKFVKNKWSKEAIEFLVKKTEIVELSNVYERILDYFNYEDPFYLSPEEQENLVARYFRKILEEGQKGGSITVEKFNETLEAYKKHLTDSSESFNTDISIGEKIYKLKKFLESEEEFRKLNHYRFLQPISSSSRHIFYIVDKLTQNDFPVKSFEFFIEKILMKRFYVRSVMRLLQAKWEQKKAEPRFLIKFFTGNFKDLLDEHNYDTALKILIDIGKNDSAGKFDAVILKFLKKEVLKPFTTRQKDEPDRGWREEEQVAHLLSIFYKRSSDKKQFIDFIFSYFNFTSDDYEHNPDTHPHLYSLVKDFVSENASSNFDYVIGKIIGQFDAIYEGQYQGYRWGGSGLSQAGSNYSITDMGVVRLLFGPLFKDLYSGDKDEAWKLFKSRILNQAVKKATKRNPLFLKRALVGIILDRIEDRKLSKQDRQETLEYLKNILRMKHGCPNTSDVIFDEIRRRDVKKVGFRNVMELIKEDSVKYRTKNYAAGYPTNIFVIKTLFELIGCGYGPAKNFSLKLIKKPEFNKFDRTYNSFELLSDHNIPMSDPDFIVQIIQNIDLENYLGRVGVHSIWDKGGVLVGLIQRDWEEGKDRGKKIIDEFMVSEDSRGVKLDFICRALHDLKKISPLKTFRLISSYLKNKDIFTQAFGGNSQIRSIIVELAEEFAKEKKYGRAKEIIELCIDDPDPETHNREEDFNYHLQVKEGSGTGTITSVRGRVGWVLQKIAASNDPKLMKYALEKTETLLDLDGQLAKRLSYCEPDYYVRLQALIALIELAHPYRRNLLNEYESGLGDKVKELAFRTIEITKKDIKDTGANPSEITGILVNLFSRIKDLHTEEAKGILTFFEDQDEEEAYHLFIFFAEFRELHFPEITFDPKWFKKKLKTLCKTKNPLRSKIAFEFWVVAKDNTPEDFERIENYWKLFFNDYEKGVYDDLYRALEVTLTWPGKYAQHFRLFMKALENELKANQYLKQPRQVWSMDSDSIFKYLRKNKISDFLVSLNVLLENLDENTFYSGKSQLISMFGSIIPKFKKQRELCKKIEARLVELYPEDFEDRLG